MFDPTVVASRAPILVALLIALVVPARADDDRVELRTPHDDLDERDARDDADEAPAPSRRRFDYSRFSDGPRRVPEARGSSKARADALGLGTLECASRLLNGRPDPAWVEAAQGTMPEHLLWPVELGRFGRGFGYVRRTRPDLRHNGVDIVAEEGRTVRAVADGIVAYSDNGVRGFGNLVLIVHPNGWVSAYAHNYRTTVPAGWRVRRGERIAFVGTTGISRGPHLHFEIRSNGHPIDPLAHFEGRPWIDAYRRWSDARAEGSLAAPTDHLRAQLPPDRHGSAGSAADDRTESTTRREVPRERAVGDVAHARRLLDEGAREEELAQVEGEVYRNALWPVRGGLGLRREGAGWNVRANENDPVRAIADGLVVYVGDGLRGVGDAVVILHRNGWISTYGLLGEIHVEVGQSIRRGEWIARVASGASPHLHFQLREGGRVIDAEPLFVQRPSF